MCNSIDDQNLEFLVRVINNLLDVSSACLADKYPEVGRNEIASIILDRVVRERNLTNR